MKKADFSRAGVETLRFLVLIFTICALLITLPLSLIVFVIYRLASVAYPVKGFLKALNQYLLTCINPLNNQKLWKKS